MSNTIEEAFVSQPDDDAVAQQQRDKRAKALKSQGYECTYLNLYRVLDGLPVLVLRAERPESPEVLLRQTSKKRILGRREHSSEPKRVAQFEAR